MSVISTFHQDKFAVQFSNFPMILGETEKIDMRVFDYFVKNVTIPDYSMTVDNIDFQNEVRLQPMSRANADLGQITVEFKANEDLRNYYYLWMYIRQVRYADQHPTSEACINTIKVLMNDNQNREIGTLEYRRCFPQSIGSLSLTYGDSSELSFPVSFLFEESVLTLKEVQS